MSLFSYLFTAIVSLLAWSEFWDMLEGYIEHIAVMIALLVINKIILTKYVGNNLLSDKGSMKFPAAANTYLLVFSMWHILAGLLSSLSRVTFLIPAFFGSLTSMHSSLYPAWFDSFDTPHKAANCLLSLHTRHTNPIAKTAAAELFAVCNLSTYSRFIIRPFLR